MKAYYNEIDAKAVAWLRRLIEAGLIADGDVDERSILEVKANDLKGYTQCHFFAGIGGWSLAIRSAGWRDGWPVWTGSCPCQPLSCAGQRQGHADERHLWPAFYALIAECKPPVVFGEQVASKDGREWIAGIRADLESCGYAFGAADLCAAGSGAPHIRQRHYWVADADQARWLKPASRAAGTECYRLGASCLGGGASRWPGNGQSTRFADGSERRIKPGVRVLVDGFPGRVATVGAFGNAIVPQVAAEFVGAFMECANPWFQLTGGPGCQSAGNDC